MSLEAMRRNGHNVDMLADCQTCGKYGIPVLQPCTINESIRWISFNCALTDSNREVHGVHFFIDDYVFERVWRDPTRYAELMKQYHAVMTPDFSLFTDYPVIVQIYNHYKKHLLGAYWQKMGINVIPSICWSDHDSYEWCFDGEPCGGTVAVSSVGALKNNESKMFFVDGYSEMIARLKPTKIIFFGDVPKECVGNIEQHDAFYKEVNARRKCLTHRKK